MTASSGKTLSLQLSWQRLTDSIYGYFNIALQIELLFSVKEIIKQRFNETNDNNPKRNGYDDISGLCWEVSGLITALI